MRVQIFVNGLNDVVGKIPFCSPFVWRFQFGKTLTDYSAINQVSLPTDNVLNAVDNSK